MHSCSAHSPTCAQSMLEDMLIMMLPCAQEAAPIEAVPMAATRQHGVHVMSSAPLEHFADRRGHHVLRMTLCSGRAVRRLSCAAAKSKPRRTRQRVVGLRSDLHRRLANRPSESSLHCVDGVRRRAEPSSEASHLGRVWYQPVLYCGPRCPPQRDALLQYGK